MGELSDGENTNLVRVIQGRGGCVSTYVYSSYREPVTMTECHARTVRQGGHKKGLAVSCSFLSGEVVAGEMNVTWRGQGGQW